VLTKHNCIYLYCEIVKYVFSLVPTIWHITPKILEISKMVKLFLYASELTDS
jgi:hypothetical protein